MKVWFLFSLLATSLSAQGPLHIYAYDSFAGTGSLGEWMKRFPAAKVEFTVFPTAGEALNQVALEGKASKADIVLGVDQTLLKRADEIGGFAPFDPALEKELEPGLVFDKAKRWLPFDYGYLAVVYDDRRKKGPPPGLTFQQFAKDPTFRKRLVLEDPRTSSLGRSLLTWTKILYGGEGFLPFWKALLDQTLTIVPGWSAAYGLFLKGEADFVVSYTTSPAYHIENEKNDHIKAIAFPEGNYRQVEAVAIRGASPRAALAKTWVKWLLSSEVQTALPLRQWMYPARKHTALPASFKQLVKIEKVIDDPEVAATVDRAELAVWTRLASEKK